MVKTIVGGPLACPPFVIVTVPKEGAYTELPEYWRVSWFDPCSRYPFSEKVSVTLKPEPDVGKSSNPSSTPAAHISSVPVGNPPPEEPVTVADTMVFAVTVVEVTEAEAVVVVGSSDDDVIVTEKFALVAA